MDLEAPQQLPPAASGALVASENDEALPADHHGVPAPGPEAIVTYDSDDDGSSNLPAPVTQLDAPPHAADVAELDVLVTVATSSTQVSSKLPRVRIPRGECVAITFLGSVVAGDAAAPLDRPLLPHTGPGPMESTATVWPSAEQLLAQQRARRPSSVSTTLSAAEPTAPADHLTSRTEPVESSVQWQQYQAARMQRVVAEGMPNSWGKP